MGVSQEPGGVALLNGGEHLQHHPSIGIRVQLGLPTFMHEWCAMTRFTR